MCRTKSIRLFLDSVSRDSGDGFSPTFLIPHFSGRYNEYKNCTLTVERFQPVATLADTDETIVLRLTGGVFIEDTYDSVESKLRGEAAPSTVIAVQSNNQNPRSGLASTYHTMTTPLAPFSILNPVGQSITVNIATLAANAGGQTIYGPAHIPGAPTTARDFYAVVRLDFHEADLDA